MVYTVVVQLYSQPGKEAEVKNVLVKASQAYSKDKGTIAWHVMQDQKDPTAWCIVERFEEESDLETHRANPFFKQFPKSIGPFLDRQRPMKIFYNNELDSTVRAKL
ncbi:DNA repair protein [Mycena venus]|uniref:DNA repair protein n=1 Tax=Mycena venus TaxID=2733690 RepID=A0A8H7CB76_9AGAR|nr:DNA repair protein [Mycena venus]